MANFNSYCNTNIGKNQEKISRFYKFEKDELVAKYDRSKNLDIMRYIKKI